MCNWTYLDGVEAAHDAAVLDFDVGWWMSKATLVVRPGALVPCELAADVERQPARVFDARSAADPCSAGADRSCSCRRCRRRGRRRRVDDRRWAQHRVDDGHHCRRNVNLYTLPGWSLRLRAWSFTNNVLVSTVQQHILVTVYRDLQLYIPAL